MENTLSSLKTGERGVILELKSAGDLRRRLLDMGLVRGTAVECVGRSTGGDPKAYLVRGAVLAIRSSDGADIIIKKA